MAHLIRTLTKIAPTSCLLCNAPAAGLNLCTMCRGDLNALEHVCQLCALPLPTTCANICGPCLINPPSWQRMLCLFAYEPPIDLLIKQLKYQARMSVGFTLGSLMAHFIASHGQEKPDVIIPIPMHWYRYWRRGFNQAMELAQPIGKRLDVVVRPNYLRRTRHTAEQTQFKYAHRWANVNKAFVASSKVAGLRVALVDDVITTGATLKAAAKALDNAQVKSIVVWSCARTLNNR